MESKWSALSVTLMYGRSTKSQARGRRTGDCLPIRDGPNVALAMDRTGKHVMGRLPIGEVPTNI